MQPSAIGRVYRMDHIQKDTAICCPPTTNDVAPHALPWGRLSNLCGSHVLVGEPVSTPDQVRGRLSPEHALSAGRMSQDRSQGRSPATASGGRDTPGLPSSEQLTRQS